MLNINEYLKAHPLALVIYLSIGTVAGSVITAWLTSNSAKQEALITSQPEILRLATETLERTNKELYTRVVTLEERLELLVSENQTLKEQVQKLKVQVAQQFDQIKTLESFPEYMPGPAWMKDKSSRMLLINAAYEREWGVSKWQYVGKLDEEVWPENIADKFIANDQDVIDCGCAIRTYEKVPRKALKPVSESNPEVEWIIWKWPVIKDGKIFGIAGAAFKPGDKK